jgi:SAM-dependent methyltransferase
MSIADPFHARSTYDGLAPHYDHLTADYDHRNWLSRLVQLTGQTGPHVLDIACGSGKSFAPLIGHGYEISACDISPAMLRVADARLDLGARRTFVADMRDLPDCGSFDLITCLDDAINYILTPAELLDAFAGIARLLKPGGMFVFDANTLLTYRTAFAGSSEIDTGRDRFIWRGLGRPDAQTGCQSAAIVERLVGGSVEQIATHRQRHYSIEEVVRLLRGAGLLADVIVGQSTGCRLQRRPDDVHRTKTVFVARRSQN